MKKYYVNIEQFTKIEKPQVAYFLGFFWADGHLREAGKTTYQISMSNLATDMLDIVPILNKLGTWGVKNIAPVKASKEKTAVVITDKVLGTLLKNWGYLEKSYVSACKVLNQIPEELKRYWWRGYFDGDGCITLPHHSPIVSFSGSYEQDFTFVFVLLESLEINYTHYKRQQKNSGKHSVVYFCGRKKTQKFYDYIYSGEIFGLNRKREKFESYLNNSVDKRLRLIEFEGKTQSLMDWSRETGINRKTLSDRIDKYGWGVEKALTTKI